MLDQKILTSYFNGLVLPHHDYADIVWGDQPTQMKQDAMKGSIPEHFGVSRSAMNQQNGYNTRNGYMPKVSRPRTEWGKRKTYYKAILDWATLPSALPLIN